MLINLIAFIVCFVIGIYEIILLAKAIKGNESSVLYLIFAIIQFVLAGLNLYLFLK